jgi:hypothetical protein
VLKDGVERRRVGARVERERRGGTCRDVSGARWGGGGWSLAGRTRSRFGLAVGVR